MLGGRLKFQILAFQSERVAPPVGIVNPSQRILPAVQSERVGTNVAGNRRIIVAVQVVVKAGLRVRVLAGVAQRCVGGGAACHGGGAPESAPSTPGKVPISCDKFGGGADEVGDDGEEAGVDALLGIGGEYSLSLGDRREPFVFPSQCNGTQADACGGLLDDLGAVPGEQGLLDHLAVDIESLLGSTAAERVVVVGPDRAVGCLALGQPVLGVPGVAPHIGFAGDAGLAALNDTTGTVVNVGPPTRLHDPQSAELACTCCGLTVGAGPGRLSEVARSVVRVGLSPALPIDLGDAADTVEVNRRAPLRRSLRAVR